MGSSKCDAPVFGPFIKKLGQLIITLTPHNENHLDKKKIRAHSKVGAKIRSKKGCVLMTSDKPVAELYHTDRK